jgi:hypothetical protein
MPSFKLRRKWRPRARRVDPCKIKSDECNQWKHFRRSDEVAGRYPIGPVTTVLSTRFQILEFVRVVKAENNDGEGDDLLLKFMQQQFKASSCSSLKEAMLLAEEERDNTFLPRAIRGVRETGQQPASISAKGA